MSCNINITIHNYGYLKRDPPCQLSWTKVWWTTNWIKRTNSPKLRFKDVLEQDPRLHIKAQFVRRVFLQAPLWTSSKKKHTFLAKLGSLMLRYALVCLTGPKTPFWCRSANGPSGTREGQIKPCLCFDRSSVPKPLAAMRIETYLPNWEVLCLLARPTFEVTIK